MNTGAFDPVAELADACGAAGAWLHVDGAFGLWAAASPKLRHLVEGVDRADSWATDAHKWLNVPYDCGLVFCRHEEAHALSMAVAASYLQRADGRSPSDWVPESSRRARGFAVWAAVRSLGRSGVAELVDRCCGHARAFAELLGAEPGVEILNDVVLNQVLVRFGDDDETTREVVRRVQDDGTCWLGGTDWQGRAAMRISVSSFRTTSEDVDRSVAAILLLSCRCILTLQLTLCSHCYRACLRRHTSARFQRTLRCSDPPHRRRRARGRCGPPITVRTE